MVLSQNFSPVELRCKGVLFDMDGRLVSQTQIRNRETTVLTNISEGNFLFEVFTDDERIENGQVIIK